MNRIPEDCSPDRAISRVVDRTDTPADWSELDRAGSWPELVGALRQDAALRHAMAPLIEVADRAPLPVTATRVPALRRQRPLTDGLWSWGGWLAALVLCCAWLTVSSTRREPEPVDAQTPPELTASDKPAAASPRVVGELPRVVLEARPSEAGSGFDVVYVRRYVERATVAELYQLALDEYGQPVPTQVTTAQFAPASNY